MNGLASAQAAYETADYGPNVETEDAYEAYVAAFHQLQQAEWEAHQRDVAADMADPMTHDEWLDGADEQPDSYSDFAYEYEEGLREAWADERADARREDLLFGD